MNYLTNYYKNLSEQLQERLEYLQNLMESQKGKDPMKDLYSRYPELRSDEETEEIKKKYSSPTFAAMDLEGPDYPWTIFPQSEIDLFGRPTGNVLFSAAQHKSEIDYHNDNSNNDVMDDSYPGEYLKTSNWFRTTQQMMKDVHAGIHPIHKITITPTPEQLIRRQNKKIEQEDREAEQEMQRLIRKDRLKDLKS